MLDGLQLILRFLIKVTAQQLVQRTHNQRQRRTDIVSGIDQELHLFLIKLLSGLAAPAESKVSEESQCSYYIYKVRPRGTIPRCPDDQVINLGIGIDAILKSPDFKRIGTGLDMTERDDITTDSRLRPFFRAIHPVFEDHILRI